LTMALRWVVKFYLLVIDNFEFLLVLFLFTL